MPGEKPSQKDSKMASNRDLFKMMSLVGGRQKPRVVEQYVPFQPDPPRFQEREPTARDYPDVEKFWKDIEKIGQEHHYEIEQVKARQLKQIEQAENYQKQNLQMGAVLDSLASAISLLVKEIKGLKIPPIKVEIPTVKIEQKPIKVEVELKPPKSTKRKGTIKHADGTTSTVEVS